MSEGVSRDIREGSEGGGVSYAARHLQHVGHELCADRGARLILLILSAVRETRDHDGYAPC